MILRSEITIDAPADRVWAATIDVERWPEWTPTVLACRLLDRGPVRVGSRARLRQPGFPSATWTVTDVVAPERFTWQSNTPGLRTTATHSITKNADGGVSNQLEVALEGPLAHVVGSLIRSRANSFLEQENAGLKAWCEQVGSAE